MNYIAICLCTKYLDFIFLLNRLNVYLLPCSVTGNHTMDLFYLLKENFKNLLLTLNQGKELREYILFIKLFVVTKMEAPKNSLKHITRQRIRPCLHKSIGGRLPIHFTVWKLMAPSKQ